jgi:hypothetical protein
MEQRWEREVFQPLRAGKTIAEVRADIPSRVNWNRWLKDPVFSGTMDAILRIRGSRSGQIPGFQQFRQRHFAYRRLEDGLFARATMSDYARDAASQLDTHDRLIMVLPPGHLKTTLFSIERSVHKVMNDRDWRGLIVQKNQGEARKVVAAVEDRLQCDIYHEWAEFLREQGDEPVECPVCLYAGDVPYKPEAKGAERKWGADGFRVGGRRAREKDDTFQALGAGSQIQGIRADSIVLDDIQDPMDAIASPKDSDNLLEWFHAVILGRVNQRQQVVVLANFFTPDDFAHKLISAHPDWPVVNYAAFTTCDTCGASPGEECVHMDARVLAPEYWTAEGLQAKRKEVGEQRWFYTWIQEEGDFLDRTFKRESLEDARTDEYRLGEVPAGVTDVFLGVDPAVAASGYCAMVVWGLDRHTKQRYLIDVFNKQGMATWDNVIDQVVEFCNMYPVRVVVIETNNTQRSLTNSPELHRRIRSAGARLETYQTVSGTGARSEQTNFDITTIGGLFDAGLVSLPYSGPFDERERVDAFIEQLIAWRTDEQGHSIKYLVRDMVMATLFAESEAFAIAARNSDGSPRVPRKLPIWAKKRAIPYWAKKKPLERVSW